MSDSSPAGPVFPPFGPARPRAAAPQPAPSAPAVPPPLPQAEPDVPAAAAFGGGELRDAEPTTSAAAAGDSLPWEMPSAPESVEGEPAGEVAPASVDANGDEDLPWLEMPAGAPQAHAAEEPDAPAAEPWAEPSFDAAPAPAHDPAPWEQPDPIADASADVWSPPAQDPAPAADEEPAAPAADWLSWQAPADEPTEAPAADLPADEPQPTAALVADDTYFGPVDVEPAPGLVPVGDLSITEPGSAEALTAPTPPAETVPAGDPEDAAASSPAPQHGHAAAEGIGGHFGEVAARLERIARELRSDPEAFLAGGTSDPLDLLVTGFVLGASQRR